VQDETQDAVGQDQNEERIAELEKKLKLLTQDNSEGGCSGGGCHEGEYSLQNEVENLEDHPSVESDSLAECMKCHASGEYAFKTLIHKVHLVEGEHYTDEYDKNCINCHEISEEGKVSVEGLEEENGANGEEVGNNEEDETNGETENGNNEE
jgi:hypothetical protein